MATDLWEVSDQLVTNWDVLCEETRPVRTPVYRMPERDTTSGPRASLKAGDLIKFSRIVARVGYEIGVHSVTKKEWFETGAQIVADESSVPIETVKLLVSHLGLSSPFKDFRHKIFEKLVRPKIAQTLPENRNVRAMWFYDCPQMRTGEILDTVVKLTGKRDPGGPSGYYGEDYDPPTLSATGRQVLYKVRDTGNDMWAVYEDTLVYPDDVLETIR